MPLHTSHVSQQKVRFLRPQNDIKSHPFKIQSVHEILRQCTGPQIQGAESKLLH